MSETWEEILVRKGELTFTEQVVQEPDPKKKKFLALFQARMVLLKIGTVQEKQTSKVQLKRMKELGLGAV